MQKKLLVVCGVAALVPVTRHLSAPAAAPGVHHACSHGGRAWVEAVAEDAAEEHDVDPAFVMSVIAAESGFEHGAVSPKGAIGYMQVMPETGEELGYDVSDCEQNIQAGTKYLRQMIDRYSRRRNTLQLAVAAYNAGPGNVDRYGGVPPFRQTRKYVQEVLRRYRPASVQPEGGRAQAARHRVRPAAG